ncbi:MAG: GNAT family N-acetyltransferase [Gammaproteobacteria bacterium]
MKDVASLREKRVPIPHYYDSWSRHDSHNRYLWCRVEDEAAGRFTGFAVEISGSRALPGFRIGRVERAGRGLHEPFRDELGEIMAAVARRVPRLERLDVQLFDEDPERLAAFEQSMEAAGGQRVDRPRSYRRTLVVDIRDSGEALRAEFRPTARRKIREFENKSPGYVAPVTDPVYAERLRSLHEASFRRTRGEHPPIDFADVLADVAEEEAVVLGTFWPARKAPDDLVAFAWCRLHGDYVVYDAAGSDRASDLGRTPLGYPLMLAMLHWGAARGAHWADLGGVIPPDSPETHPLYGISSFKRQFSRKEIEPVSSEFRFEPHPALSAVARGVRGMVAGVRRRM